MDSLSVLLVPPQGLDTVGGPAATVRALAEELSRIGHRAVVDSGDWSSSALSRSTRLFRLCEQNRSDVIHIHGSLRPLPAALFCRSLGFVKQVSFTFHTQPYIGAFLDAAGTRDYPPLGRRAAIHLLDSCDAVSSVSESILANLRRHYSVDLPSAVVIPSGVAASPIVDPDVAGKVRESVRGRVVITTIGVFAWDWKVAGQLLCIDAMRQVATSIPNATLLIAGEGHLRPYLESRSRGQGEVVRLLGRVTDISSLLDATDIYVHMALNEGCPLAVLEAMRAGKPIIAANRGGIPEVIKDGITGLLVEPTAEAVADAILRLRKDTALARRLGEAARTQTIAMWSWPAIARQYVSLYSQRRGLRWE